MRFRNTILVTVLGLVAGMLGPTAVLVDELLEDDGRSRLALDLGRSSLVFEELQEFKSDQLQKQARVSAAEPRLKAIAATEDIDHETVLGVAQDVGRALGVAHFTVVDGEGRLLADTRRPKVTGVDVSEIPLVHEAFKNGASSDIWTENGELFQMAAKRMDFGDVHVGVLVLGYKVGDVIAQTVQRQTASTVLLQVDGVTVGRATDPDRDLDFEAVGALVAELDLRSDAPAELTFGGGRYIATAHPIPGYGGTQDVRYIVLRSLDDALVASTKISRVLYQIAGTALLVSLFVALFISYRLAKPLQTLVRLTRKIAQGDLAAREDPSGPVEIRELGRSMNDMAINLAESKSALDASLSEIATINAGLETTVERRTQSLQLANAEIAELLDNLQDAVFVVDDEGLVTGRWSAACPEIFALKDIEGQELTAMMFGPEAAEQEALSQHNFMLEMSLGGSRLQWETNRNCLLPQISYRLPSGAREGEIRTLDVRYAPLYDADDWVNKAMLIVSDVTEVLALKRSVEAAEQATERRTVALKSLLAGTKSEMLVFVDDVGPRMELAAAAVTVFGEQPSQEPISQLFRQLHTIKGNARMLKLSQISSLAHKVEDAIHPIMEAPPQDPVLQRGSQEHLASLAEIEVRMERLSEMTELFEQVAADTFRANDGDEHRIAEKARTRVLAIARDSNDARRIEALEVLGDLIVAEARAEVASTNDLFAQFGTMVAELATELGKEVVVEGDRAEDLYLMQDAVCPVREAMAHTLRNALDHGLESPDARERAGKPRTGKVWLRLRRGAGMYQIEIHDDGAGINLAAVAKIAKKRGLFAEDASPSAEEVVEALFAPGFSSREEVSEISGRGVGLDAVRQSLTDIGGRVELRSTQGRGTTLVMQLPMLLVFCTEVGGRFRLPHLSVAA